MRGNHHEYQEVYFPVIVSLRCKENLPKQIDVSDQSSDAEHPNKHAGDSTGAPLANIKAEPV